jgi:hypothetical protein
VKLVGHFILYAAMLAACSCVASLDGPSGPTLLSVSPTSGATGVSVSVQIVAEFSENISPASATTGTFYLRENGSDSNIGGTITVSGSTVSFQPSENLDYSKIYNATLSGDISNLTDTSMASDYAWSFETATGTVTKWITSYGRTLPEIFYNGIQTSDGGFLGVGSAEGDDGFLYGLAVKLDLSGEIEWSYSYGKSIADQVFYSVIESDDGFLFAGYTNSYSAFGDSSAWVVKVDPAGEIVWQNAYDIALDDEEFRSIVESSDGEYFVSGSTFSGAGGPALLAKIDSSDGSIIWDASYATGSNFSAANSYPTSDGGIVFTGLSKTSGIEGPLALVAKLDMNGLVVWDQEYGDLVAKEETGVAIRPITGGGYVFVAQSDSFGFTNGGGLIVEIDATGTIQRQKVIGSDDGIFLISDLALTDDGGYLVSGAYDTNYSFYHSVLLKLDSSFDVDWQKSYGFTNLHTNSLLAGIGQTDDGGYMSFGSTSQYGYGDFDAWAMVIDSDGNCGDDCELIADSNFVVNDVAISSKMLGLFRIPSVLTEIPTNVILGLSSLESETQCFDFD